MVSGAAGVLVESVRELATIAESPDLRIRTQQMIMQVVPQSGAEPVIHRNSEPDFLRSRTAAGSMDLTA